MNRDEAEAAFAGLREALGSAADAPEDGIEVETFNEKHYSVVLTFEGKSTALPPDVARDLAEGLLSAADEADSLMSDEARQEQAELARLMRGPD